MGLKRDQSCCSPCAAAVESEGTTEMLSSSKGVAWRSSAFCTARRARDTNVCRQDKGSNWRRSW